MIPQLLLEEIALGEKRAEDYYEKYGKEEIEKALAEINASNEEILKEIPVASAEKNFVKKSMFVKETKSVKTFSYIKYAAAAAFAFALILPFAFSRRSVNDNGSTVRVKGNGARHHQIRLYKKDGNSAVSLTNGSEVRENDVIQITYLAGEYNYGVIFSVDGNGNVTRHFPEESWKSEKLEKTGEEVPLKFSYELDDAPKYECFIFVASKKPFDMSKIEDVKKSVYDINFLKKGTYLPEGGAGSIFVLNKD